MSAIQSEPLLSATPIKDRSGLSRLLAPQPLRKRKQRRSSAFRCIMATSDQVVFPQSKRLGYLKQARLIEKAQSGDLNARNEIWLRHARLAYSVVGQLHLPTNALADALQEGQLGILRALQKFEVHRLNVFSTYAYHWVLQHVRKLRTATAFFSRIPDYRFAAYLRFRRRVCAAPARREWFDARESYLDRDPVEYRRLLRIHVCVSPVPFGRDTEVADGAHEPYARMQRAELRAAVWDAVDKLLPRERQVICCRYGLPKGSPLTLEQIGHQLGLTRERVRQVQLTAEATLRQVLYAKGIVDASEWSPEVERDAAPPESATQH